MPLRRNPSRLRRPFRSGGALLEAALVLPILFALGFGMVEYGYFFFVKHALQGAARDGARVGIVPSGTNAKIQTTVSNVMQASGLSTIGYQVDIKNGSTDAALDVSTATTQTPVKVVVRCTWSSIGTGLRPMGLIPGATQCKGAAVMMKE
jgi:Flp pilus assembly protein TadG